MGRAPLSWLTTATASHHSANYDELLESSDNEEDAHHQQVKLAVSAIYAHSKNPFDEIHNCFPSTAYWDDEPRYRPSRAVSSKYSLETYNTHNRQRTGRKSRTSPTLPGYRHGIFRLRAGGTNERNDEIVDS